jgi:hypothetical protein
MRTTFAILVSLCVALPAFAADMPMRKAGLWEIKSKAGKDATERTMQQCTDAATDQQLTSSSGGMTKEECSKRDVSAKGNVTTIDSVCTSGGKTHTSHIVVTGSFESAYTADITSKEEGDSKDTNTTLDAKYLGACKSGQKPGDVIMSGGFKINVIDMQKFPMPNFSFPGKN